MHRRVKWNDVRYMGQHAVNGLYKGMWSGQEKKHGEVCRARLWIRGSGCNALYITAYVGK